MNKTKRGKSIRVKNIISILIDGPGRGHNSSLILDVFNRSDKFNTTLITGKYSFSNEAFPKINIVDYYHKNKLFRRIKLLWKLVTLPKVDILYLQGGGSLYNLVIFYLFGKYKKLVFNIWSEGVIIYLDKRNLIGFCYRYILRKTDKIQCNWYGTYNLLIAKDPKLINNSIVIPWGLDESFFTKEPINSMFVNEFIEKIPSNKIVLLNMRSISEYNNIEILLESFLLLKKEKIFDKLLLIFWPGNNIDIEKEKYIYNFLLSNDIRDQIWYCKHPFLLNSDIRHIIERSDIIVNLVKHDQLSLSILEALYLKKEMICSDIEPYRIFNDKFDLNINLVKNDPVFVAEEIKAVVLRVEEKDYNDKLMEHRKCSVENNFKSNIYLKNITNLFQDMLS